MAAGMSDTTGKLPAWAREVISGYESAAAGEFLLHGNVGDRLLVPGPDGPRLGRLQDYLLEALLPRFEVVLGYDLGHGLKVERGVDIFNAWPTRKELGELPQAPLAAVRVIDRFLFYLRNLRAVGAGRHTAAVILRDADLYLPELPGALHHELDSLASIVRSWASDHLLPLHGQAVFLLAGRLNAVHHLVSRNPRACEAEVPLPAPAELEAVLAVLAKDCPKALAGFRERLAHPAQRLAGTSVAALEAVLRRSEHAGRTLAESDLSDLRKALVERDGGELIEFVEPDRTLDDVIGLDEVKRRLRDDLALWRGDDLGALPMGYLFCGPVGTGKTFLAECLAGEAGIPVVTLRNFRDRWVGSTEANLEKIFHLLHALGRCIVFIDEADQALGRRSAASGDSGVSNRVYSMLAAEMSDTRNRGRILWVLASSRPDLIEVDLKRPGRVDVKVPIFPALDSAEGMNLLVALCRRRGLVIDDAARAMLLPKIPALLTPGAAETIAVSAYRLTRTAQLDAAAALADCLDGYLPPVAPEIIRAQMQLAAEEATDAAFVPATVREMLQGA